MANTPNTTNASPATTGRKLIGWTAGDGSGHEGYHADDYFRDGVYLGPDCHGIEPIFEDTPDTNAGAATQAQLYILPAGHGAWDITSYPYGGDFMRPAQDLRVHNVRPSAKDGEVLCDCVRPNRPGQRTICVRESFLRHAAATLLQTALKALCVTEPFIS